MRLPRGDDASLIPPPLRSDGLFRRSAPFVAAAVLGAAAATSGNLSGFSAPRLAVLAASLALVATYPVVPWERLPRWLPALPVAAAFTALLAPHTLAGSSAALQLVGALALDVVALGLYMVPWDRVPHRLHASAPLGALVALILLGAGMGTSSTLLFPIAMLAVLWLTLHHGRGDLLAGVALAAVVFLAPPHLHASYPDAGARLLYTAIVGIVAISVHDVVMRGRRQAAEATAVAADLTLMQDVAATLASTLDADVIVAHAVRAAAELVSPARAARRRAVVLQRRGDELVEVAGHALEDDDSADGGRPGGAWAGMLSAPLLVGDTEWGELAVSARSRNDGNGFDDRQRRRLQALADVTGLALANALSYTRQRRTARDLLSLVAANLALANETEPESVLQTFADTARDLGRAEYAAIAVISADGRRVESFTESGAASDAALETFRPFDMDRGVAGTVMRERQAVRLPSLRIYQGETPPTPLDAGWPTGTDDVVNTALLGMPLQLQNQLLGAIYLIGKVDGTEFTADDEVVAGGLAAQAAVAITNARLVQRLAEHAATDPLTGLLNRREFERIVGSLPRQNFAVLAIDIDNLKALNDEFGHEAGDLVLQICGATLGAVLRGGDVLARVGGDEFAALLLDVDATVAADVAERMRSALHGTALPHGRARISLGCAPAPRGADPHGVWRAADDALYQAKRSGKDRVVIIEHGTRVRSTVSSSAWAETLVDVLDERTMESVYQPIVSLDDRATVAFEALARPGALAPSTSVEGLFLAAQRLGRMRDLDWVCRRSALEGIPRLRADTLLFVNVSTVTLLDPIHDVDQMLLLCQYAEQDPSRLVLEITERETVRDVDRLKWVAAAYREHGVRFALDDVGEGHSTLEVMAAVSPEFIKIASSLTTTIDRSGSRAAVRATIAFAGSTGAAVIAEGVENDRIVSTLQELGVPLGQGFWLGRPQRASSLPTLHSGGARPRQRA